MTEGLAAAAPALVCAHAARCPGCPLLAEPYDAQLLAKRAAVARALGRYPDLGSVDVLPARAADPVVGYRARAKLVAAPGARLGLYADGADHEVVDVPGCLVLRPELADVAAALRVRMRRDEATSGPLAPRGEGGIGSLRAVDLREVVGAPGDARVLVTFVVTRSPELRLEALREAARELAREVPAVVGVGVSFHDGEAPQVLGSETVRLAGEPSAPDRLGSVTLTATFGAFTQAHRGQAAAIVGLVTDAVRGVQARGARVLDVYGGSGAFALTLAAAGADVTMIESFAPAVASAKADAARQGLRVEAIRADAGAGLQALLRADARFDAAIVNPPRRGVHPDARRALARLSPELVAYVSCDPETLARDLDHLARLGYRAAEALPFDMIPLTDHVEALVLLRRAPPPPPRVLYEDADVIVVDKPPHEPTTPQGEHASSLTDRVRRLSPGATPVHRLDVGTSGVVFFARSPDRVAPFAAALAAPSADKVYLAAARGLAPARARIDLPIRDGSRSLAASTEIARVATLGRHCLVEARPAEGRTHQIRLHLRGAGHPVLGDARYGHGPTNRHMEERHGLDRTFLHCARIALDHPKTNARLSIAAELPGDLAAVLARLSAPARPRAGYG